MKQKLSLNKKKSLPYVFKERFYNYPQEERFHIFFPSLYMYFRSLFERIFHPAYNVNDWMIKQVPALRSTEPVITWIGHATFLLQIGGLNILTDPIFCSPSILYKRLLPPGLLLNELPPIDGVIISHNHPDHMSGSCLKELERKFQPHMLLPQKVGAWFTARKFCHIHELTWWQKVSIPAKDDLQGVVDIWFLPSRHWSQRGIFDRNKTLWGSWMISYNGYHVYFGGDTAYGEHFKEIGQEFNGIQTALLPIGPGEPHELLHHSHINSSQAVKAFIDLEAQQFIPMHWGTFHFGTDHFHMPIEHLRRDWHSQRDRLGSKILRIVKVGEQVLEKFTFSTLLPSKQDSASQEQPR